MNTITKITGLTHPYIRSAYLKAGTTKTLVIEALKKPMAANTNKKRSFTNSAVADLMIDLPSITHIVQDRYGAFDQVDIRTI